MGLLIHHLRRSQSERLLWLCEELNIPYELKCYDRDPQTMMAPPEYKALSSSETSPVINDGDLTLAETSACIEYIIQKYGNGKLMVKPSEPGYSDFIFWWHYGQGSLQPSMMMGLIMAGVSDENPAKGVVTRRKSTAMKAVNERLGKTKFLAGEEFTAADIVSLFYFTTMRVFMAEDLSTYPNIVRWMGELGKRPAYVKAMEKGDPGFTPLIEAK